MRAPDHLVTVFLGLSGFGKTFLARHHLTGRPRVLIHDPNAEEAWAAGAVVCDDRAELVRLIARPGPLRICWRGISTMGLDAFEWANRAAWAGEGFTVVWDEVDRFTSTGRLPHHAYQLINAGRHRGCRIFAIARRPFRVPRDITAAAGRICAFRITSPPDIDYLRDFMGPAADQLPDLKRYVAIDWTEAGARVKKSPFR